MFCSSDGCGIDLGGFYILSGGRIGYRSDSEVISKVSNYSTTGWTEDLDDLNTARAGHACSFYTTDSGDKVGFNEVFLLIYFMFSGSPCDWRTGC